MFREVLLMWHCYCMSIFWDITFSFKYYIIINNIYCTLDNICCQLMDYCRLAEVLWGRKTHSQVNAVCSQCVRWKVMTSSAHMWSVTRARLCSFFTSQWHWTLCFTRQVLRGVCTFFTVIYHTHYGTDRLFVHEVREPEQEITEPRAPGA